MPKAASLNSQPMRLFVLGETNEKVDIGVQASGLATEAVMRFTDADLPKHRSYYYELR